MPLTRSRSRGSPFSAYGSLPMYLFIAYVFVHRRGKQKDRNLIHARLAHARWALELLSNMLCECK